MKRPWIVGGIVGALVVGAAHSAYAVSKARKTRDAGYADAMKYAQAYCAEHREAWGKAQGPVQCTEAGRAVLVGMTNPAEFDARASRGGWILGAAVGAPLGAIATYMATR